MPRRISNINEIIIHVLDTPVEKDFDISDVNDWHRQRGFTDENSNGVYCGYHFIILKDGTIQYGRPLDRIGAHCIGHNRFSVGVALEGGKRDGKTADTRTSIQTEVLHDLVLSLFKTVPSIQRVSGHNRYSGRSCPNFNVEDEFWYIGRREYE